MRRGLIIRGICALALCAPGVFPAGAAAAAAPAPGCGGIHAVDRRGDAESASEDIVAVWADWADGVATLNIQVSDLKPEVPAGATFRAYDVAISREGQRISMRASVDSTGSVSYWAWESQAYVATPTDGAFFPGPDGVVQLAIPASFAVKPGDTLTAFGAATRNFSVAAPPVSGFYSEGDHAGTSFTRWVVGTCAAPAPVPPAPAPPAPPAATAPAATPAALPVTVGRAVRRGRTVAVRLRSDGDVTGLRATLSKGSRTVAVGRLAKLAGNATLRLRAPRALAKGRYALRLTGTVAGTRRTLSAVVRLAR